jgi:hypothetical protein
MATEREGAAASEREAFEAWAIPRCLHLPKRPDGEYASVTTQETWEAWLARAALSCPVAAQPADSAMVQIPREAYLWLMGLGADGFAQDRPGAFWWRGAFNERANLDMTAIAQSKETPHER